MWDYLKKSFRPNRSLLQREGIKALDEQLNLAGKSVLDAKNAGRWGRGG